MLRLAHGFPLAINAIVDLVLPPRCPGCNKPLTGPLTADGLPFCEICWQSVIWVTDPCLRCGAPAGAPCCDGCRKTPPPFSATCAPLVYGGQLAAAVRQLKYGGATHHCRALATLLRHRLASRPEIVTAIDGAVPVPLHRNRLRQRGFNQAALIAREALRGSAVPIRFDLLKRTRATGYQTGLDPASRRENVRGAFVVAGRLQRQRLLIVDDVMTTGATVAECARSLLAAGAAEVHVLTLARAVP